MEKVRLGDVCEKGSSNIAQKDLEGNEGKYPIYGASGLIKYVDFYKQDKEYIAIVKDGAGVGRTMILPAYSSVIGTMQYIFPKNNIDISFLYYAITHMGLGKYFSGATIPHIYFKDYQKEKFNIYEIEEQKKIAYVLDKITELIDKRKQQLEKLDELVKSRFVEMFGDPVINPMKWVIKSVIEECSCMVPGRDKPKSFTGDIPWITIEDLNVNGITIKSQNGLGLTIEEINQVNRKTIPIGSVIMSCVGNLGVCSIAGQEMVINQQLHSFQCGERINNIYLMYNLSCRKDFMNKWASNTTVLYMNKTICNSIPIMLPPIDLQQQFAAFVEQTDKSKLSVKQALEKLETLKKALMQKYFE
ncbi:MAG: restriction endonuclease subunit S [Clostridia bacterium]|nr:restriction endonuclease subunit S [Clostridia bacterium]